MRTSTRIRPSDVAARDRPGAPSDWLLPEDQIIDHIAVEIAASGTRRVALTPTERQHAARRILATGGTTATIAERLHISFTAACRLATQVVIDVEAA